MTLARPWRTCFLLGFFFLLLAGCRDAAGLEGRVEWIYDGDTLRVSGAGKVRLIGVDAPEMEGSARDDWFRRRGVPPERLRQVAAEALRFTIEQVKGKRVRLEFDGERRDRHGRLLAYVVLPDGRTLNRLLIERGYAAVYRRFDFRRKQEFLAAEAEARRLQVGLWRLP